MNNTLLHLPSDTHTAKLQKLLIPIYIRTTPQQPTEGHNLPTECWLRIFLSTKLTDQLASFGWGVALGPNPPGIITETEATQILTLAPIPYTGRKFFPIGHRTNPTSRDHWTGTECITDHTRYFPMLNVISVYQVVWKSIYKEINCSSGPDRLCSKWNIFLIFSTTPGCGWGSRPPDMEVSCEYI